MNIKIDKENLKFKFRVAGIVIVDNKLLTVQIMDNGFYCLPGGHVNVGETSLETIKREMYEEADMQVEVKKLLTIIENFFTRKNGDVIHELNFIYLLEPKDITNIVVKDYIKNEEDEECEKKLEFKWIPIDEINDYNVKPVIIKEIIDCNFKHYVIKDSVIYN